MFDNFKKKLKGIFGKPSKEAEPSPSASEETVVRPSPVAKEETVLPPVPEEIKPQSEAEKQILEEARQEIEQEAKQEIEKEAAAPAESKIEGQLPAEVAPQAEVQQEEKAITAEEKVEEIIAPPEIPKEEVEIVTVEPEPEKPAEEETPVTAEEEKEEILPEELEKETAPVVEEKCEEERPSGELFDAPRVDIGPQAESRIPQAEEITPPAHKPKEIVRELEQEIEEKSEDKPGFFKLLSKITHKELSEKDIAPVLWELEVALLENDVAKEVSEKIIYEVRQALLSKKAKRGSVEEIIKSALKNAVSSILSKESPDILKLITQKKEKPFVIIFFGFNGTGKTLTIGKIAKMLLANGISAVMAAGDTFRAAAIEQLEVHAKNLNVPIIKQKKGSDSAAVIFDAIKHAKAKGIDVVLADTAGRSHTNVNLMDELRKIVRVSKPDLKIFVGDSLTGNDAAEQAKLFNDAVGIDGSVLTKIDTDAKGGSCLSVAYVTGKPILYLGTGQDYGDMIEFSARWFVDKLF